MNFADSSLVETGEEGEEVYFTARARLYHFDKKAWKERGTGNIKVNVRYEQQTLSKDEKDQEADPEAGFTTEVRKARIIMRADGVHRVILNTPVFRGMTAGGRQSEEPVGKTMYLDGLEDGQPQLFQIKVRTDTGLLKSRLTLADRQGRSSEGTLPQDTGAEGRSGMTCSRSRRLTD
jgi:hypothetical protein